MDPRRYSQRTGPQQHQVSIGSDELTQQHISPLQLAALAALPYSTLGALTIPGALSRTAGLKRAAAAAPSWGAESAVVNTALGGNATDSLMEDTLTGMGWGAFGVPGLVAAGAASYHPEAEASGLQRLLQLMYRGRTSEFPPEVGRIFMSPQRRYAENYALRRARQGGGVPVVDSYFVDPERIERLMHNMLPERGGNLQSRIGLPNVSEGEAELMGTRMLPFAGGGLASFGKALARRAMSAIGDAGQVTEAPRGALSVVKPKGGNWLSGSVEQAVRPLRRNSPYPTVQEMEEELAQYSREGDYTDTLKGEIERQRPVEAVNNWIDTTLTKYIKRDMATPEDPVRALADRGILHMPPIDPGWIPEEVEARRVFAGMPPEAVAKTDLGAQWEQAADYAVYPYNAGDLTGERVNPALKNNPWLAKLNPEDKVYAADTFYGRFSGDLGLEHLVDELRNATNPNSGLPPELLLRPESLNRVSMPQAVEHVAKINAWRAAQLEKAKLADMADIPVFKEYPEQGFKWVELRQPKLSMDKIPQGVGVEKVGNSYKYFWPDQYDGHKKYSPPMSTREEAEAAMLASDAVRKSQLSRWLKEEGNAMGHCVGGYCDEVATGKSQIFSLRDAKGQPHVTIEVEPDNGARSKFFDAMPEEEYEEALNTYMSKLPSADPAYRDWTGNPVLTPEQWDEFADLLGAPKREMRIVQVKGKGNAKPKDDYLPFVQDFVRSQQWSDVGDMHNTGLKNLYHTFNDNELARLKQLGADVDPQGLATQQEIEALQKLFSDNIGKYASGGLATTPPDDNTIDTLIVNLLNNVTEQRTAPPQQPRRMASGGVVAPSITDAEIDARIHSLLAQV